MPFVTLVSALPATEVERRLGGSRGRFRLRVPGRLVQATGVLTSDTTSGGGEPGTRMVADTRPLPEIAVPVGVLLALLVLVSFSEPAVFVALLVVLAVLAVLLPRARARLRADRAAVLAELGSRAEAAVVAQRPLG